MGIEIDKKATGERLKLYAQKNNVSVPEIQSCMGFQHPTAVYNWFTGKRVPTIEHFMKLSQLFGCTVNELCVTKEII